MDAEGPYRRGTRTSVAAPSIGALSPYYPRPSKVSSGYPAFLQRGHSSENSITKKQVGLLLFAGSGIARALSGGSREATKLQEGAIRRLQGHTGSSFWTRTKKGRIAAIEASVGRVPAKVVQAGLDCTLSWLYSKRRGYFRRNWKRLMFATVAVSAHLAERKNKIHAHLSQKTLALSVGGAIFASSTAPMQAKGRPWRRRAPSPEQLQQLRDVWSGGRGAVINAFPLVLEIALTDPNTGERRPLHDFLAIVEQDRSFLGL